MTLALNELLAPWSIDAPAIPLTDLHMDSRLIQPGSLFLAVKGHDLDGRQFIAQAVERGAVAVIYDNPDDFLPPPVAVPCIPMPLLSEKISQLAGLFYHQPSHALKLVGVTGTNGKSTTTHLIANWAELLGSRSGLMGTLGNGLFGELSVTENTTGSPVSIQQTLDHFVQAGAHVAAMEISSHGLDQYRVSALSLAAAVFTNLSRDHLDYHRTMEAYAAAKYKIFRMAKPENCILNGDDATARGWLKRMPHAVVFSFAPVTRLTGRYVYATDIQYQAKGVTFTVQSSWGTGTIMSPLLGAFNVSNLLAALATMLVLGYDLAALCESASRLRSVTGRMECFGRPDQPTVVVDYAHTPDGLEKALQASRQHCHGKLFCLVGCGGDRDTGKRPQMASIAERLADHVILTDDNPRTEDPAAIIADMQAGLQHPDDVLVEHNRPLALDAALRLASVGDVILMAGKGHEDYQIIGKEKHHYSDRETVMQRLGDVQ